MFIYRIKNVTLNTNKPQAFIPKQQFYLDSRWKFLPNWLYSVQWNWVAERIRDEADIRKNLDDYSLINMTLRRNNIAKHWGIGASIKNLLDEDIRQPSDGKIADDYPMNQRSAFIELNYNF